MSSSSDAVSPVVAVILMVAVTVILSAVIGTFALNLGQKATDGSNTDSGVSISQTKTGVTVTYVTGTTADHLIVETSSGLSKNLTSVGESVSFSLNNSTRITVVEVVDGERTVVTTTEYDPSSVSGATGPTYLTVSDDFEDNAFDTSKWTKVTPGNATVTEENGVLKLRGGGYSKDRPYLRSTDKLHEGSKKYNITIVSYARLTDASGSDAQQYFIVPIWDGKVNTSHYSTPRNGISAGMYGSAGKFRIYKHEGGDYSKIATASFSPDLNWHRVTVTLTGNQSSMDVVLKYDGTTKLSVSNIALNNTSSVPYVGYSSRESMNGADINNTTITVEK